MKKFLTLLCTIILFSLFVVHPNAASVTFKDITKLDAESKKNIAQMYEKQLIKGTTATTFSPNKSLTNSQITIIMGRYLEKNELVHIPSDWELKARYSDLPVSIKNKELLKYAAIMKDNGILVSEKLQANVAATRGQMAVILDNTFKVIVGENLAKYNNIPLLFNNSESSAISGLVHAGITNQTVENFKAKNTLKRVQFVNFFIRWENYITQIGFKKPENEDAPESKEKVFKVPLADLELDKVYEVSAYKPSKEFKSVQHIDEHLVFTYESTVEELYQIIQVTADDQFGRKHNTYRVISVERGANEATVIYNTEATKTGSLIPFHLTNITATQLLLEDITAIENYSFVDPEMTEPPELFADISLKTNCSGICIAHMSNAFSTEMMQFDAIGYVTNSNGEKVKKVVNYQFYFDANGILIHNLQENLLHPSYKMDNRITMPMLFRDMTIRNNSTDINDLTDYYYFASPYNAAIRMGGFIEGTTIADLQTYFKQSGRKDDLYGLKDVMLLVVNKDDLTVVTSLYVGKEGI
ncbi:MAG: S-layer homology domain-containing protein, partial [Lysinibacillus sp.]